jgi:hypothetical protein
MKIIPKIKLNLTKFLFKERENFGPDLFNRKYNNNPEKITLDVVNPGNCLKLTSNNKKKITRNFKMLLFKL